MKQFALIKTYFIGTQEDSVVLSEDIPIMEKKLDEKRGQQPFDVLGDFNTKEELFDICKRQYDGNLGEKLTKRFIELDTDEHWGEAVRLSVAKIAKFKEQSYQTSENRAFMSKQHNKGE